MPPSYSAFYTYRLNLKKISEGFLFFFGGGVKKIFFWGFSPPPVLIPQKGGVFSFFFFKNKKKAPSKNGGFFDKLPPPLFWGGGVSTPFCFFFFQGPLPIFFFLILKSWGFPFYYPLFFWGQKKGGVFSLGGLFIGGGTKNQNFGKFLLFTGGAI